MGNMLNSIAYRLGLGKKWVTNFVTHSKLYRKYLNEDLLIFRFLKLFFTQYTILTSIATRSNRKKLSSRVSGLLYITENPFITNSLVFSNIIITRVLFLQINCFLLDSLLEEWRFTMSHVKKATSNYIFKAKSLFRGWNVVNFTDLKCYPKLFLQTYSFLKKKLRITRTYKRVILLRLRPQLDFKLQFKNFKKIFRKIISKRTQKKPQKKIKFISWIKKMYRQLTYTEDFSDGHRIILNDKNEIKLNHEIFLKLLDYNSWRYTENYQMLRNLYYYYMLKVERIAKSKTYDKYDSAYIHKHNKKFKIYYDPRMTSVLEHIYEKSNIFIKPFFWCYLTYEQTKQYCKEHERLIVKYSISLKQLLVEYYHMSRIHLQIKKMVFYTSTQSAKYKQLFDKKIDEVFYKKRHDLPIWWDINAFFGETNIRKTLDKHYFFNPNKFPVLRNLPVDIEGINNRWKNKQITRRTKPNYYYIYNIGKQFLRNRKNKTHTRDTKIAALKWFPSALFEKEYYFKARVKIASIEKTFKLTKVLLLLIKKFIKGITFKQTFFSLILLKNFLFCYIGLFKNRAKLFTMKIINLIMIKEFVFKHLNMFFFQDIFYNRFIIFNQASRAIVTSLDFMQINKIKKNINFCGLNGFRNFTANFLNSYILIKLSQYFTITATLNPILRLLKSSSIVRGFKFLVVGRLTRQERASILVKKYGQYTRATKTKNIDYAQDTRILRFGMVGLKIWILLWRTSPCMYYLEFHFEHYTNNINNVQAASV